MVGTRVQEPSAFELPPAARALLAPHPDLGVPVPAFGGRSLPNVAASLARALGGPENLPVPPLARDLDPFRGGRAGGPVVLVVVDGLGYASLRRAARAPNAPESVVRWGRSARPISTVFPTGTAVALTSLSTAAAPSQHGVVGHRAYLPRFGSVVELLRMSPLGVAADNALVGPAWSPSDVRGVPTVFELGVRTVVVSRDRFEGSGFTRMIYEGAEYAPYATFADLAHGLVHQLERARASELVLVYWDELDLTAHRRGPSAALTSFETDRFAQLLAWVAGQLPGPRARGTTVLLTADHGLVPSEVGAQLSVERAPRILELLARPPTGDRRAAFFAPRPGARERLAARLREKLGAGAAVLDRDTALGAGLFGPGPYHPELAERIGELVVVPSAPGGILYRVPGVASKKPPGPGAHGGLDPDELLVPLVTGTLDDFAGPRPLGRPARRTRPPAKR